MMAAETSPETGKVITHEAAMLAKIFQSMPSPDFTVPTATTLPTWKRNLNEIVQKIENPKIPCHTKQCVVETGNPSLEANNTVTAGPNSMVKPLN